MSVTQPVRSPARVLVVDDQDVVALPVEILGEICRFQTLLRFFAVEEPHQRRLGHEILGQLGERDASRKVVGDLVADLQHRLAASHAEELGVEAVFLA